MSRQNKNGRALAVRRSHFRDHADTRVILTSQVNVNGLVRNLEQSTAAKAVIPEKRAAEAQKIRRQDCAEKS